MATAAYVTAAKLLLDNSSDISPLTPVVVNSDGVIDFPAIRRMVEAAGYHGLQEVDGVLGADHHVAKLARAERRPDLVHRERQHVGRSRLAAPGLVELGDPLRVDELDGHVAVGDARRRGRVGDGLAHAVLRERGPDHLDVEHVLYALRRRWSGCAGRSPEAWPAACWS